MATVGTVGIVLLISLIIAPIGYGMLVYAYRKTSAISAAYRLHCHDVGVTPL
jgi:hypothetical protein